MKKILKTITLITISVLGLIWTTNLVQAASSQTVYVTERIPWANCSKDLVVKGNENDKNAPMYYECKIDWGIAWFYSTLQWIIKYFTFIVVLTWVMFIVINWIAISMSWIDSWAKEAAKWRILKTIWGLVLLLLSWVILNLIAPWVYQI